MGTRSVTISPPGSVATIVGGFVGATIGGLIAIPIGNANADGGLEALGVVLLVLFVGVSVGASIGVGVALRLRHHARPLVTALITFPAMFLAVIVAVRVIGFFGGEGPFNVLLIVVSILFLWLARTLAVLARSRSAPAIKED